MPAKGFLLFVLHTHQPFVALPADSIGFGEDWLFEVIIESYIPLLDMCHRLLADGIHAKLTFSLTPPLTTMLRGPATQQKFLRYAGEHLARLEKHLQRRRGDGAPSAEQMHYHRFRRARDFFERLWRTDLTAVFRGLQDDGLVSLLASTATHAYLPVWQALPGSVELQIAAGLEQHNAVFGCKPCGFWLPECGFYPGLDYHLRDAGVKYFFVDGHALLNAQPRPVYGIHAPVHTPAGLAALARDARAHDLVWRDTGYPGNPAYLTGHGEPPLGLRVRCADEGSNPYNPPHAYGRCLEHARHFVSECRERVRSLSALADRGPLIVAVFDTEHFGHFWHEGPQWLELVIRTVASEAPELRLVTAEEYLRLFPTNQEAVPSMSSWGWQGYGETWLMGRNDWIYPELFDAWQNVESFLRGARRLSAGQRACLNQYLREFLLAQSSDWAYMLHAQQNETYVRNKLQQYFKNMKTLLLFAEQDLVEPDILHEIEVNDKIFPDVDLVTMRAKASPDFLRE